MRITEIKLYPDGAVSYFDVLKGHQVSLWSVEDIPGDVLKEFPPHLQTWVSKIRASIHINDYN